jgi:hypothetical protein
VVVPPLMMMESPSPQSPTAARAMARFRSILTFSATLNGRPAIPTNCGGCSASAPPRTRRSRPCT